MMYDIRKSEIKCMINLKPKQNKEKWIIQINIQEHNEIDESCKIRKSM